jgi:acetyl-CoA C-acetyltransferase
MEKPVIISAVRTPIGKFGGGLSSLKAVELGGIVIKAALERLEIKPTCVDEVIMGNVLSSGQGMNPARQSTLKAGLPNETPAITINKVCGSGLKAIIIAAQAIKTMDATIVVAGGMESMSQAPYIIPKARFGFKLGNGEIIDSMINDGLYDCMINSHMGITAEHLAKIYNITREEADAYALESQLRAETAIKLGVFKDEIIPVRIPQSQSQEIIISEDEHPRFGSTLDKLKSLKPVFDMAGVVTAGNSSGINDGASALVITSETIAKKLGVKPKAYIQSYASIALDPKLMGLGPCEAAQTALKKAGKSINDMDLIEINEAFAVQVIAAGKKLDLDWSKTNVNGGAIALGHPIGASGARLLTTLLFEMEKRDSENGLATLCIGGGQGIAMVISR